MTPNATSIAPDSTEFAAYYGKYTSRVKSDDIVATLESQIRNTQSLLGSLSEAESEFRYAPDKWNIRQMLGHVIDTERIFSYRALRISRGDKTPIEGFDQFSRGRISFNSVADLLAEFETVRRATVFLFRSLDAQAWSRRGIASQNEVTVRALAYIIAGHELHHMEVLRQKYLPALKASR